MIRSLPTHSLPATGIRPTPTAVRSSTATVDFRRLMQPVAATTTAKPAASTTPSTTDVPHLGPFTGDPNTHPATPPPSPPAPVTSSPYLPSGYPGDTDLMNKTQHEQTMNDWLQNYTRWSNDNKTQIY